jgi:NDP-sugar pyrophosphorylase family protein
VEKPATYISTLINCGVYIFSQQIFGMLQVAEPLIFSMVMAYDSIPDPEDGNQIRILALKNRSY